MSLELAIQENTAALRALINILTPGAIAGSVAADVEQEAPREEPAPKTKRAKKEAAPEISEAPETVVPEEILAATEPDPKPVTYAEAAAAVTLVVKEKGRDAAKAILAQFNATNLKEIPEARFGEVLAAAQKVLA